MRSVAPRVLPATSLRALPHDRPALLHVPALRRLETARAPPRAVSAAQRPPSPVPGVVRGQPGGAPLVAERGVQHIGLEAAPQDGALEPCCPPPPKRRSGGAGG
eukprot:CAMPEP_0183797722 /NCGR_PEP_ID=MMETSP0803_2-20130417/16838_1 /TAXON_ID=195967 /ORGANISM="Crustomastix stigmata, Strain CCMP3273" /LENGTH=103 /DNA_ID=CAMNT_0026042395 /DNA_START=197 /DNA_END=505 /DNA_ORIENTATION=+